jgi:hypothetical protein
LSSVLPSLKLRQGRPGKPSRGGQADDTISTRLHREELDVIMNYNIKYRTGCDGTNEEEE